MNRKKRLCTLFLAASIVFGVWAFTFTSAVGNRNPQPGEMGYLHGKFHDLYLFLGLTETGTAIDCCSGQDCRVTIDLKPPTAEEATHGVIGNVLVEGLWCPVRREQLVDLPQHVKLRGTYDPHVQEFQNLTHVCASMVYMNYWFSDVPRPPQSKPSVCPTVYCVKEGGAKS